MTGRQHTQNYSIPYIFIGQAEQADLVVQLKIYLLYYLIMCIVNWCVFIKTYNTFIFIAVNGVDCCFQLAVGGCVSLHKHKLVHEKTVSSVGC